MTTPNVKTGLQTGREFQLKLSGEVARAAEEGLPYAVLACRPQHLPGENVDDLLQLAAQCVRALVRDDDLPGLIDNELLVIGLHDTDVMGARIFRQRLQSDLSAKALTIRMTAWDAAFVTLHEDGNTGEELLAAAIDAAKNRRRHLGLQ